MPRLPYFININDRWKIAVACVVIGSTYSVYRIFKYWHGKEQQSNLPPGPKGEVSLFSKGKISLAKLRELQQTYGDIFHVQIGGILMVFLNTHALIREAFVTAGEACSSRSRSSLRDYVTHGCGILHSSGEMWKRNRRLTLSAFRDFGVGSSVSEKIILDELEILLAEVAVHAATAGSQSQPKPFDIKPLMTNAVLNVISVIVFGCRLTTDPRFAEILPAFVGLFGANLTTNPKIARFWRLFLLVPGDPIGLKRYFANHDAVWRVIAAIIDEHERSLDETAPRDLIDAYLINRRRDQQEQGNARGVPKPDRLADYNVVRLVWELFIAATESTSTTLCWAVYLLAKHEAVQRSVQAELDATLDQAAGDWRPPASADRATLRFTYATLRECERFASSTPIALAHVTDRPIQLNVDNAGKKLTYNLPTGALVYPNVYAVHHDARWWPVPDNFDVANCYDATSNTARTGLNELLIPFSVGRRSCVGEGLALQELLLFFAGVFHRFEFFAHDAHPLPLVDETLSPLPVRHAPEFRICARQRY